MAVILKDSFGCRVMEGNNDISSVKSIDIRMRVDEVVSATVEIYPLEVFVEVERLYTFINDVKYQLVRIDEEGDAKCTEC